MSTMTTSTSRPNTSGIQTLPKTIEGATTRYLRSYESQFKGTAEDKKRLKNYAEAKIYRLRRKAPKFYEERLPTMVNQAASALLACDMTKDAGIIKFNEIHCQFLRVLDELKKSQPAGPVDFQVEYDRFKEKEQLRKRHLELREKIDRLEAVEFDLDDLGEDEAETKYAKLFAELDREKVELRRVATLIAKMEGEQIEDETKFELRVPRRSILERLSLEQLKKLETLIENFLVENKRNRKAMYVDKSVIDNMIAKLGIDMSKFTKEDLNQISKDALDAYRTFFRDIENERRNNYFDSLINNKHLKPKEGLILDSPDDVPEEVLQKLIDSDRVAKRKLDDCFEEFAKRPCNEDIGYDEVNDEEGGTSGEDEIETTYVKEHSWLFNRIKEEPRDDYENDAPSEDEMIVGDSVADGVGAELGQQVRSPSPNEVTSSTNQQANSSANQEEEDGSSGQEQKCDDDFQMLGVVEPIDKVEVVTIDDDD